MERVRLFLVISSLYFNYCSGVSLRRQLEHIARARAESQGLNGDFTSRRFYQFDPRELSSIVGIPSMPNHLPEAEPVLPGHTLIRPSLGMLKSAVKFPHKELEDGAGVYGNIDNLGIRYDGRNERVLYTGFRRTPSDYIMIIPTKTQDKKAKFNIASTVLDLDKKGSRNKLWKALTKQNVLHKGNIKILIASLNGNERLDGSLKRFVPVHLEHLYNFRDRNSISDMKPVLRSKKKIPPVQSSSATLEEPGMMERNIESKETSQKSNWLTAQKNFDHIEVDNNAPEYNDLIPKDLKENLRQWWFYTQQDFKELSNERR